MIIETYFEPARIKKTIRKLGFDGFSAINNMGYVGGIIIAWREDNINVDVINKKFQFIHVKVRDQRRRDWFFTAVYASPNVENHKVLWDDLRDISVTMADPWLVVGDFNDIAFAHEKK